MDTNPELALGPDRQALDAYPNPAKWCSSDRIRITTLLLVVLLLACLRGVMSSKVSQSQIWLLGPSTKRRSLRVELAFVVSARGYRNSSTSGLGVSAFYVCYAWFKVRNNATNEQCSKYQHSMGENPKKIITVDFVHLKNRNFRPDFIRNMIMCDRMYLHYIFN
jgi:hypothetical protein